MTCRSGSNVSLTWRYSAFITMLSYDVRAVFTQRDTQSGANVPEIPQPAKLRPAAMARCVLVWEQQLCSRFLYPNPVVLLSTTDENAGRDNLMTLTWLTPANNKGGFLASIRRSRFSAEMLRANPMFVLNIPCKSLEAKVFAVGSCSGRDCLDKFQDIGLTRCQPGWDEFTTGESTSSRRNSVAKKRNEILCKSRKLSAVAEAIAHLVCVWHRMDTFDRDDDEHDIVFARIVCAFVRPEHWSGKVLLADHDDPYMTFLGSKQFAYVRNT